ncbi:MAG: response regulator [Bernardetiaceae bacterium]
MLNRIKSRVILYADDDPEDRMLAQDAFEDSRIKGELRFVNDGEELLAYLHRKPPFVNPREFPLPQLILLDLNMPRKDGREVLKEIKTHQNLRHIPIIILTTSRAEEDIARTYGLGGNSFITKPVTYDGLVTIMKTLAHYWLDMVEPPPMA